jgi:hypothetical protein
MWGHFRNLHFKTFPMTPRTFQCKVFWVLLLNSEESGVPEDSTSPTLGVLGFTPTLGQSGVVTPLVLGRATNNTDTQDSPQPELRGSHHLTPYSILCSSRRRLYPNGSFSRDSWIGVPKLSRVRVPGLWEPITPDFRVRSQQGLIQSCSPRQDLSNAVLHFQIRCQEEVDSWLLVVRSQTAS